MTTDTVLKTPLPRTQPVYTRIAVFGLLTVAVGLLVLLVASGSSGLALLPFIVVPLVVAGLAWRFATWAKILAAVVGLVLLLLGVTLGFLLPAFSHPDIFFEFMPAAAYLVGATMAVAGGVVASLKRRDVRREATLRERRIRRVTLATLILLGIVSAVASVAARTAVDPTDRVGAIAVTLRDLAFVPGNYEVTAGQETNFVVHNSDPVFHTFTVPEVGIDADVKPASDVAVEFYALQPGTYTIICKPHASRRPDGTYEGMTATLIVR